MSLPTVAVAQLGARKHYQEPSLFQRWGVLDALYTDLYIGNSWPAQALRHPQIKRCLPAPIRQILDRYDSALDHAKVIHFPWLGYKYARSLRNLDHQSPAAVYLKTGQAFCQHIIDHGLSKANTIYGFNGACLELFQYAKSHGLRCILDQTLAESSYYYKLLQKESSRWTDWVDSSLVLTDSDLKLTNREQQEQDLADQIICGSAFVQKTLIARGVSPKKIFVIPLGGIKSKNIPTLPRNRSLSPWRIRKEGLNILFAGSVGLRKGFPYLLEALRHLKGQIPFACKAAGPIELKLEKVEEYSDICNFLGHVPRSEMSALYSWADVFVLPSICEGSAMVTYEALQHGLPIITTQNSGSIVQNDLGCQVVPVGDALALSEALAAFFDQNIDGGYAHALQFHLKKTNKKSLEKFEHIICCT